MQKYSVARTTVSTTSSNSQLLSCIRIGYLCGRKSMMFFRRKHQKLDETSDEPPQLRHCDISSGSDSINSFDPSSYTQESIAQSPIMVNLQNRTMVEYPSRIVSKVSKPRRFWKLGWPSQLIDSSAKRRKKALAELDKTLMQIRGNSGFVEALPSRSMPMKANCGVSDIDEPYNCGESSKVLPREVTWKRRVSSLEAFFKKECKSKHHYHGESFNESAIMKVVPFESIVGKSGSSFGIRDEINRPKYVRPKPPKCNSTFEGTVEKGVSDILGKINSRSEEILDIVPDWSVASSSVDFMSAATSDDDETSTSGYRQIDSSWSPTQRSTSSGEDDEFFTTDGGCNSVESCATMTKDFETLLEEIMPRDLSMFSCYTISKRKKKRRRKKLL